MYFSGYFRPKKRIDPILEEKKASFQDIFYFIHIFSIQNIFKMNYMLHYLYVETSKYLRSLPSKFFTLPDIAVLLQKNLLHEISMWKIPSQNIL